MGVAIGALLGISIHALREEGDSVVRPKAGAMWRFLSTPSARRATPSSAPKLVLCGDFYPRPPRGGRPCPPVHPAGAH